MIEPGFDVHNPKRPFDPEEKIDLFGSIPFVAVHLGLILLFFTGFSWTALLVCLGLYTARLFGITAGYHRYFSHRSFKTSRVFQFVLALLGNSSGQMGPLWWAAHHRTHHRSADTEDDVHSPTLRGIWWSHVGWILCRKYVATDESKVKDLAKYPELRWLNRHHYIAPILLGAFVFLLGWALEVYAPSLGTTKWQMLAWGFFASTVLLYHATFTINSVAHLVGRRRYETRDSSRNNALLALITMGEGWHNNHHYYPGSERQGFYWWEIDVTHYILRVMSWTGLVWDLKTPPEKVFAAAKAEAA